VFDSRDLKGVILESFGAGNVPNDADAGYTLIPVIKDLVKHHEVPIVTTTSFVGGRVRQELYAPGKEAKDVGAIPAGDLTTEMAAVKLMWLLAQPGLGLKDIRLAMTTDFVGEVTPLPGKLSESVATGMQPTA
jgi:L-asparaginase